MCYATGLYLPSFIHYSSSWSISWSYEHGCCNCGDAIKSGDNHYLVSWYSEVWQGYTTMHVEHLSALLQIQCCYLHCVLWFERTQDSALGSRSSQHNVYSLSSCLLPGVSPSPFQQLHLLYPIHIILLFSLQDDLILCVNSCTNARIHTIRATEKCLLFCFAMYYFAVLLYVLKKVAQLGPHHLII